jgi:hypothetical protein
MANNKPTQANQILFWLKQRQSITPLKALKKFGSFRLSARIYELKQKGYKIHKKMIITNSKKYVAEYRLEEKWL